MAVPTKWKQEERERVLQNYPVEVTEVRDFPDHLKTRSPHTAPGKWHWLRILIVFEMGEIAGQTLLPQTRRLKFPNKKAMLCAQAAAQGCAPRNKGKRRTPILKDDFSIQTRSEPVGRADGEYYLYIRVVSK